MISVIIPSYNRAATIERSARSVLNQTYTDIELIIVDDCSTDRTEAAVAALGDSRVRYIRHEKNQGACVARNTGVSAANGEYIAFQDSDDAWYPTKLEVELAALVANDADLVFCKYSRVVEGVRTSVGPEQYQEGFLEPVTNVMGIGTQTLLGKREVFEEFEFDTRMPRFQELELLIRVSEKCAIYCVDQSLVDYCVGADSISRHPEYLYVACRIILEKHPELAERMPQLCKSFAGMLTSCALTAGKTQELKRADVCKLSLQYDRSLVNVAKNACVMLGCYELLRSMKRQLVRR